MNTSDTKLQQQNELHHGDIFPGISMRSQVDILMFRVLNDDDYFAFEKLFREMYDPLCVFLVRFVHVKEVAEELVSDVFYHIWKNRKHLSVSSPRAYLFTAVRNKGYDYLRKVKQSVWCDLAEAAHVCSPAGNSISLIEQDELAVRVNQSIASLPRQCRLIFEMSRERGLKYKEIASMLNISIKTVETQMGRALKRLRESLPAGAQET
jgi:RNA polymerase sigma-70 factor (ECF subfamily)